jgi:hypothetical protein
MGQATRIGGRIGPEDDIFRSRMFPPPPQRTMLLLADRLLRRAALILACAAAFSPTALRAQAAVRPGVYVRILAPSATDSLLTGTVLEMDSASLLLAPPAASGARAVRLREIERLEVRRRGGRKTFTGALVGTVVGAAAGFTLAQVLIRDDDCEYVCGAAEAGIAIAGGTGGMIVGAMIGGRRRWPDRWDPVPVP